MWTGTLPRNFHAGDKRPPRDGRLVDNTPLPLLSSGSTVSSHAHTTNTTFDSGFLSDSTYPEIEGRYPAGDNSVASVRPEESKDGRCYPQHRSLLHQDNPTYGCVSETARPRRSREGSRKVSSVVLKIESGLFATVDEDDPQREGRGRDRRPLDPSSPALPPPPPSCIIVSKLVPGEEAAASGWKTATLTTGGTFLARCVKIEDL